MKKILTTLAVAATLTTVANADFARVEMGGGVWNQTPEGFLSYTDAGATGKYTSNKKEDGSAYLWMLIKHPIPIVPNLRLEYTNIKDNGIVTGKFEDFDAPANTTASLELTQYDVIPYYNILDNTMWTTLDIGIDLKVQETNYQAKGVTIDGVINQNYNDSETVVIPMVYARVRVELPLNIGVEADGKYITYDGSTIYDMRAKIDYTFDFVPVVQPAIEVGYRVQKFDIENEDGDETTKMDMEFSGVYAGLMLRF